MAGRAEADSRISTDGAGKALPLLLSVTERRITRRLAQVLAQHDCSVERWHALALLAGGESHRMSELVELTQLPPASVTRLIDGMVADDLVHRTADPRDRRIVLVQATRRGRALYRSLSDRIVAESDAIFGDVGEHAINGLVESLAPFRARGR